MKIFNSSFKWVKCLFFIQCSILLVPYEAIALKFEPDYQSSDSSVAIKYLHQAKNYLEWEKYDSAFAKFDQAKRLFKKNNLRQQFLESEIGEATTLIYLGNSQKVYAILENILSDSIQLMLEKSDIMAKAYDALAELNKYLWQLNRAKDFQEKAVIHWKMLYGDQHPKYAKSIVNLAALMSFFHDELDSAKNYAIEAIEIQKNVPDLPPVELALSYKELGRIYYNMRKYDLSLDYLKKALSIYKVNLPENHPISSDLDNDLGNTYFVMGLLDMSLEYYLESFRILKKNWSEESLKIAVAYHNLGMVYGEKGEFDKAISSYKKTYDIASPIYGDDHPRIGDLFYNIGIVYSDKKIFDSAKYFIKKSIPVLKNGFGETHQYVIDAYNILGSIFYYSLNYDSAIYYYNHSIEIIKRSESDKNFYSGAVYQNLGRVFYKQNHFENALFQLQKAMTFYAYNFVDTIGISNPSLENVSHPSSLITALNDKGNLLFDWHKADSLKITQRGLFNAFNAYLLADKLIDEQYKYATSENQKLQLSQDASDIYIKAVEVALAIYDYNKYHSNADSAMYFLNKAFMFCEKSKATLLSSSLKEITAKQFGQIPDSLLSRESEIKGQMADLRNVIVNTSLPDKMEDLKSQIFNLNQDYLELINFFEKNYPFYHQLKYKQSDRSIGEIQQTLLQPNQAILEYFTGDSLIYLFVITKNTSEVFRIKFDSVLDNSIMNLLNSIKNQYYASYVQNAHALYEKLILPSEKILHEKINQLLIIPDEKLFYIPFDALVTQSESNKKNYQGLKYLISDYIINYHYSTGLLSFMHDHARTGSANSLIAFAPEFRNVTEQLLTTRIAEVAIDISNLGALPHAEDEVKYIADLWNGKALLGQNATEESFVNQSGSYNIIHFASHTLINDENPMFSKLIFSSGNDTRSDGLLNLYELYQLELNANLVVLSACNTGIGKQYRGEGMMSLGRGFMFTGVANVIMSLWTIPDEATATIMKSFYRELKSGYTKAEALRRAKLSYLANARPALAAPYYWSAHILTGNLDPLSPPNSKYWIYIILGMALLLFFLNVIRKKRMRSGAVKPL